MIDQWYEQYSAELTRFVRSKGFSPEDADDLCSQVFLEAMEYQPVDTAPRAWLYLVAQHRIVDRRRRDTRRPTTELEEWNAVDESFETQVIAEDEKAQIRVLIGQLAPGHRQVLTLRFLEGQSLQETAHALSTTVSAVKARQARAQSALRQLIEQPDPAPVPVALEPEPDVAPRLDNHAALLARCLRLEMENELLRNGRSTQGQAA